MSLLFFDMEFTGLRKDTTIISLGIVSEDGKKFYAEFTDYDRRQCDDWILENVVSELLHQKPEIWESGIADRLVCGTQKEIMWALKDWLQQFDTIQFISDVCHYDFVLLIDLLTNGGTALDLPGNISAVCHDLNQDIAQHFRVPDHEAFDMRREQIMNDLCRPEDIVTGDKHNSLYDAEVIRAIWRKIRTVEECRAAVERQKPKKCERGLGEDVRCPICGTWTTAIYEHRYCSYCGQRLE